MIFFYNYLFAGYLQQTVKNLLKMLKKNHQNLEFKDQKVLKMPKIKTIKIILKMPKI